MTNPSNTLDVANAKIVLIGAYGSGNLGDDVLLDVVMHSLLKFVEPHEIVIIAKRFDYLEKQVPGTKLLFVQDNYDLNADVKVYGGGTQFFAYAARKKHLAKVWFALTNPSYTIRKLTGKLKQSISVRHTAMLGIGIGPFDDGQEDKLARISNELKKCDFIGVRDQRSFDFCQERKLTAINGADLAFTSTFSESLRKAAGNRPPNRRKIAFILRDWPYSGGHENYLERIEEAAERLAAAGEEIDFIVFSHDSEVERPRLKACGNYVRWDPNQQTTSGFVSALADYKAVVTSRYHGAVFSFLLNTPVIGINVDPKIELFFQQIGAPDLVWSHPYDLAELTSKLEKIESLFPSADQADQRRLQLTQTADQMVSDFETYLQNCLAK